MRLPFLQIDADFVAHKSRDVAAVLGCSRVQAVGHLSMLWAWALSRGPEDAAPDGVIIGPRAAQLLESGAEWTGERGAFVDALADQSIGLLEQVEGGYRVRGMDRYRKAWDRQRKDRDRKADVRRTSSGQAQDGVRQTQIETQTQTHIEKEDPPNPPGGEGTEHLKTSPLPPEPQPGQPWTIPDAVDAVHRVVKQGRAHVWDPAMDEPAARKLVSLCSAEGITSAPEEIARRYGRALERSGWTFERAAGKAVTLRELARPECWKINSDPPKRMEQQREGLSGAVASIEVTFDPWEVVLEKRGAGNG